MSRTHLAPGNSPSHLPKPPGKVAPFQQLATVQKGPPETPADRTTCHSPAPGGRGVGCTVLLLPSDRGSQLAFHPRRPQSLKENRGHRIAGLPQNPRFRTMGAGQLIGGVSRKFCLLERYPI